MVVYGGPNDVQVAEAYGDGDDWRANRDANAHMIAAAPTMREELEKARSALLMAFERSHEPECQRTYRERLDAIDSVLTYARGAAEGVTR